MSLSQINLEFHQLTNSRRISIMSLNKISLAIASVVVLAAGAPAFANDAGTVQTVIQTNTINGNGNTTINSARQTSVTSQRGGRGSNAAGTSQTIDQLNTVDGDNNFTSNRTVQTSTTRQNSRR
jgi:hypothetical protein